MALLALWAAFDVVRSRGQADGWTHRQQLFSAAAGLLTGVCGLQVASLLPSALADQRDFGGLLVTPGAGLFLIMASVLLAIAALVLNWLAVPSPLPSVTDSPSAAPADERVPPSPATDPGGTPTA